MAQIQAKKAASNELAGKIPAVAYDLDSNKYTIIKLGNQYWFKENLRTSKYNDTTAIATGLSDEQWKQTQKGAYSIYENNPLHEKSYGKLYNGYAVATGKLCPKGWRVSTDKDWKELEKFIGFPAAELDWTGERGDVADKIKTGTGWKTSPFKGNNSSGFSIEPAGARLDNGEYTTVNQYGNFWTSTVYDDRYGLLYLWNHHVNYNSNAVGRIYTLASNGYSCRCVWDEKTTAKKPAK
ncbi:fibrobacter succinogenes major paralogous domain-containing protein [Flavihumibacter sp. ZG627]|uniref:fibrobacter succinogenes major paralogous domain-containing protein n=1 Tax=Flavihumibacter sp. ZG627 TaxID=1463156 RepID=UPI0006944FCE|nr:fibrobacter succinogenes major paralogous domain-containing protein [Flavihumibacter sp. ZG627]